MYRRRHTFSIAALLLLLGSLPMAMAQRSQEERLPDTRYQHGRLRRLKACVLLIPTPGEPTTSGGPANDFATGNPLPDPDAAIVARSPNPYPYLFYVLNERTDMRPDGWRFFNPAAPTYPTAGQVLRWGGAGLTQARQLTPDMAPYWEVVLSPTNMEKLTQMDVIYLPIARRSNNNSVPTYFTEEQRQMLSRIVDSGATLWVDWAQDGITRNGMMGGNETAGAPTNRNKNGFFVNLDFGTYGGVAGDALPHPLMSSLFVMQPGEGRDVGSLYSGATTPSQSRMIELRAADQQPTVNFTTVVPLSTPATVQAYIAAARYGAGYVVATAGNVGKAIAGMIPFNTLRVTNALPRPDLGQAQQEDLKFAYNVFAWRNEVTAEQKNPRRTAQSGIPVNGMIEQWTFPNLVPGGIGGAWTNYPAPGVNASLLPANPAAPLVVNGVVIAPVRYFNGGNIISELQALEANPADDLDGNGYSDDPISPSATAGNPRADLSIGQNYDRLTSLDLGSDVVNGMTVGEVPDPTAGSQGSRAFVFGATSNFATQNGTIFAVPVLRPGLPATDDWPTNKVLFDDSTLPVLYTGAPSFVNIPAPMGAGVPVVASQLIAGGIARTAGTNSATAGKVVAYNVPITGAPTPSWYYPPNLEANRLGPPAGPVVTAQVMDQGTGAIDTMVFVTTAADPNQRQANQVAGDTSGKVEGFVLATKGELLGFPTANNNPSVQTPDFGRRFTAVRWLNIPQNSGPVPPGQELAWDPTKHYEVRVLNKNTGYVVARFTRTDNNIQLLPDGTGGQVLLPSPGNLTPPAGYPSFSIPGQPSVWNLQDYVLVADYSWQPIATDNNSGRTLRPRFSPPTPYLRVNTAGNTPVQLTGVAGGVAVGRDNLVYYGTGNGYMCAVEWRRGRAQFRWKFRSLEYDDRHGTITSAADLNPTNPNHLSDFAFTAAPAAGDRIVFASRGKPSDGASGAGTVYVLDPDATLTFKLQMPSDAMGNPVYKLSAASAQDIMLEGDHGTGIQQTGGGLSGIKASLPPFGAAQGQFSVNPDTETVTFHNMQNVSLDLNQAVSAEQLLNAVATGFDTDNDGQPGPNIDTGGKPAAPIRWWIQQTGNYLPNNPLIPRGTTLADRRRAWVPLPVVAIYKSSVPNTPSSNEQWRSGPVISGDRIYLMGATGHLHEIPVDPKTIDPRFPLRRDAGGNILTGLTGHNVGDHLLYGPDGLRRVRGISYVAGMPRYSNPAPAISQGIVAIASPRGITAYGSPNVVVADTNRVVEASGDSTALASLDVTIKHRIDQSEFAIPTDPSFANTGGYPILTERKSLNRMAVVRKLNRASSLTSIFASSSLNQGPVDFNTASNANPVGIRESPEWAEESYIGADTGNNRCVEFNAAGKVIWELDQFQDPFNLLPAGESTKISQPTDVQRWVELEQRAGGGFYHVIHTLIADSGNNRVVEVVDKVLYQQGVFNAGSYVTIPGQKASTTSPPDMNAPDVRWYHVLVWTSQTNAQGLRLKYRTAQRVYWPDGSGSLIPNPNAAGRAPSPTYPYLPEEPYLSYTMASVSGQQVLYPKAPSQGRGFNQFYTITAADRALIERKPVVRPGGDSIVFLRGRLKLDEANRAAPVRVTTYREDRPGVVATGDANIFAQGIIDPNVPVINDIYQEVGVPLNTPVHRLNGVSSIQRTIRSDVRFAPDLLSGATQVQDAQAMFFLVADTDGVWEMRMTPFSVGGSDVAITAATPPVHRLAWAFTIEDYAYVTGAGNGDPTAYASPVAGNHAPGGRLLSAASARRLANGLVLVASRTPLNPLPPNTPGFRLLHAGADVFLLRPTDFRTFAERVAQGSSAQYQPYQRGALFDPGTNRPLHGWSPDLWVQSVYGAAVQAAGLAGAPSIRWRAAEQIDPKIAPSLRTQSQGGTNPLELTGTYLPVQPNYADLVF